MATWGPGAKAGAVLFSFDNLGEAAELEFGSWPAETPVGAHASVYETLPFLLDVLREYGLKTTFFLEAWNADHYPDAVRAVAEAGHEVGGHGYRHEAWFKLSDAEQVATLNRAHESFGAVGITPVGFRPPAGITTPATEHALKALGYLYVSPTGGGYGLREGLAVLPSDAQASDVAYYTEMFAPFRHPLAKGATESAAMVDGFRIVQDEVAREGSCRSTTCHVTTPLDTPDRRDAFRRLVEMTLADDRLWTPTCREAAEWVMAHPDDFPNLSLDKFGAWDPRGFWTGAAATQERERAGL